MTILVDKTPDAGEELKVYYGKQHTLDATSSTIPSQLEDVVAIGTAGYAALEWSSFATNRANVGGPQTWHHYLVWGQQRLAQFHRQLARLGRRASVRTRRLYTPERGKASQTEVQGP